MAVVDGRRRGQGRGGAAPRRHPVQRRRCGRSDDPQFYEKSALFHACNLGKRGITLDLGHPDGLALAKRLVARSDVVVENFTPQVLERFGLDWDIVHARIRPDAVMLRMPAFGLAGPWRDRPGFAQTMEQITGMAWVTGYEGGPPIIPGGPVDPMVGAHAALAIVAALEHRDRTGDGQLVEVPLLEVATAVTAEQVIRYAIDGTLLDRRGTGGVYRTAGDDAWVSVDLASDPMPAEERAAWCATAHGSRRGRRAPWVRHSAAAMVPAFATLDDPQLRARGFFEPLEHPVVGRQRVPDVAGADVGRTRALLDRSRADARPAQRRSAARRARRRRRRARTAARRARDRHDSAFRLSPLAAQAKARPR